MVKLFQFVIIGMCVMIVEIEKNNIIITPLRWFLQHVFVSKTVDYFVKGGILRLMQIYIVKSFVKKG